MSTSKVINGICKKKGLSEELNDLLITLQCLHV